MNEKPILFSTEMVRAILEGRKTVTRRVIKPQPYYDDGLYDQGWIWEGLHHQTEQDLNQLILLSDKCPYQVGRILWVRETFVLENDSEYGYTDAELKQFNRPIKLEDGGEEYGNYHLIPHYRATEPEPNIVTPEQDDGDDTTKWHPSIFMPRWASRITLEVTGVRVERLQEITQGDIKLEGCGFYWYGRDGMESVSDKYTVYDPNFVSEEKRDYGRWFRELWDSINAKRGYSWESNPYVWVISFKKL